MTDVCAPKAFQPVHNLRKGEAFMKSIFGFLVLMISFTDVNPLFAQWVQTSGPGGGSITSFAVSGTNLFASTAGGEVFLSTNSGTSGTDKLAITRKRRNSFC